MIGRVLKRLLILSIPALAIWGLVKASTPARHRAVKGEPIIMDDSVPTAPSPKFYIYKPDPNIKVDANRFRAGLLFDVENQKVVWQKEMSSVYPIASLTKMMVA